MLRDEHREGSKGHVMRASQEGIRTSEFILCYRKSDKGGV